MLERLRHQAKIVRREVVALYFVARDPATPRIAKAVAWFVAAYALSPIDLVPDFIPVVGYLDDLIIVPLGIMLAVRLVPDGVMERARVRADLVPRRPKSTFGLLMIVSIWIGMLVLLAGVCLARRKA